MKKMGAIFIFLFAFFGASFLNASAAVAPVSFSLGVQSSVQAVKGAIVPFTEIVVTPQSTIVLESLYIEKSGSCSDSSIKEIVALVGEYPGSNSKRIIAYSKLDSMHRANLIIRSLGALNATTTITIAGWMNTELSADVGRSCQFNLLNAQVKDLSGNYLSTGGNLPLIGPNRFFNNSVVVGSFTVVKEKNDFIVSAVSSTENLKLERVFLKNSGGGIYIEDQFYLCSSSETEGDFCIVDPAIVIGKGSTLKITPTSTSASLIDGGREFALTGETNGYRVIPSNTTYPFTPLAQVSTSVSPKLSISAYYDENRSVAPSQKDYLFMSIVLNASGATEDVKIMNLPLVYNATSTNLAIVKNCQVFNNAISLNTQTRIINPNTSGNISLLLNSPVVVGKNTIKTVYLKCDVAEKASGSFSWGVENMSIEIVGLTSGKKSKATIKKSSGPLIQVSTNGWVTVSMDLNSPLDEDVIAGASNVELTKIKISSSGENVDLKKLSLQVGGSNTQSISKYTIWDAYSKVAEGAVGTSSSAITAEFNPPLRVTVGSVKYLSIKGDFKSADNSSVKEGDTFSINYDGDNWQNTKGIGVTSGAEVYSITKTDTKAGVASIVVVDDKPKISVISPNGSETWTVGDTKEIKWKSERINQGSKIRIEILNKEKTTAWLISTINATSSGTDIYPWVATTLTGMKIPGEYYVRLSLVKSNLSLDSVDYSDTAFTVSNNKPSKYINITSPKENYEWEKGTKRVIRWESAGISLINIGLYRGETKIKDIAKKISAKNKSYIWSIPDSLSSKEDYSIVIKSTDGKFIAKSPDLSLASYGITVLSPNGGEKWEVGSLHTLRWKSIDTDKVNIFLRDSVGVVNIMAKNYSTSTVTSLEEPLKSNNEKRFDWTIGSNIPLGDQYYMWIGLGEQYKDKSDRSFSIISPTATTTASTTSTI